MKIVSNFPPRNVIWIFILANVTLVMFIIATSCVLHLSKTEYHSYKAADRGGIKIEISELQSIILSITHLARGFTSSLRGKNQTFPPIETQVNVSASTYNTLVDMIEKHSEEVLVLSVATVVALAVYACCSTYVAVKFARKETELNSQLRRHVEAERKAMNKSIAVATASHDVRAALACITALVQLSYNKVVPGSDLDTNLTQINTCTTDLLDLLNSILDASKIEAGKMQLEEAEFDLSMLLEEVADLYHPVGMKKGVDVVLDPCDGSLSRCSIVKGDRLKLKRVICNLLGNAVKFTTQGHVSLRAWARRPTLNNSTVTGPKRNSCCSSFFFWNPKMTAHPMDPINEEPKSAIKHDPNCMEYVFEVDDTGKGIPKESRKAVFEDYVQVKDAAAMAGGTGLGLAIVQSLVRLMGGEIEIVEKPLGQSGTCFKFNLFLTNFGNRVNALSSSNRPTSQLLYDDYTIPMDDQSSYRLPNHEKASLVVLLMQNEGRRRMIRRFLEGLGIMVVAAKDPNVLPSILEEVDHHPYQISLSQPCVLDANCNVPIQVCQAAISFVLLIIDANAGELSLLENCVARSRKELIIRKKICCKVVWIEARESRGNNKGEEIALEADYVTSKPLHGSRLFEVIRFLPEFRAELMLHFRRKKRGPYEDVVDPRHKSKNSPHEICKDKSDETRKSCLACRTLEEDSLIHTESLTTSTRGEKGPTEQKTMPTTGVPSSCTTPLFGKRVLIAEDNELLMLVAATMVKKMGAFVDKCRNGQEAVDLFRRGLADKLVCGSFDPPYDYILMDCEMPLVDGFEATRLIRKGETEHGLHIPIIALTSHAAGEELDQTFNAGMDYHLQKPLHEAKLMEAITSIHKAE